MNATAAPRVVSEICARTQSELVTFLDGELLPVQKSLVETHLAACPNCAAECDALRATLHWADALPTPPEIDVVESVLQYISLETPQPALPYATSLPAITDYRAHAESIKLPFIDLDRHKPEASATATIPAELARRHRALPIRKDGQTLFVAMANPRNIEAIDAFRMTTRCMIRPMQAVPERIDAEIERVYPPAISAPPSETQALLDGMREMQAELAAMRREMTDLRRQLSTVRGRLDAVPPRPDVGGRLFSFGASPDWAERER